MICSWQWNSTNKYNKLSGEQAKRARHSLGVLNANLQYIFGGTYVTTFSSVGTPYVMEAELCHSHFLGRNGMGGVKYLPLDTV